MDQLVEEEEGELLDFSNLEDFRYQTEYEDLQSDPKITTIPQAAELIAQYSHTILELYLCYSSLSEFPVSIGNCFKLRAYSHTQAPLTFRTKCFHIENYTTF